MPDDTNGDAVDCPASVPAELVELYEILEWEAATAHHDENPDGD